jgi:hypothetical protein
MGPIALFDKSFIQSLSVDESVWFDHFFMPVVCPIFFVGKINTHFSKLSDAEKEGGIMRFAGHPPTDASMMTGIWERLGFGSRSHNENLASKTDPEVQKRIAAELNAFTKGEPIAHHAIGPDGGDTVSIERRISRKKGSWWQVPKDLPGDEDE